MHEKIVVTCTVGLVGLLGLYFAKKSSQNRNLLRARDIPEHADDKGFPPMIYDLSIPVSKHTLSFPGDPVFQSESVSSVAEGKHFDLCRIQMGNHTGTHVDFPKHVIFGGKSSSHYKVSDLVGNGLIIRVPDDARTVDAKFVASQKAAIFEGSFVFFKTANSKLSKVGDPVSDYVHITPEAAQALLRMKVKVVGIDYISVDSIEAEDLPVHKILLEKGVLIVENLDLAGINSGNYEISIAPLKIEDADGLPARVTARPMR